MTGVIGWRGRSLVDRVVDSIGQDIISNRFPSGTQLPNEGEWCERLNVSRSVMREALRVLVSKNLIVIRSRSGGRVREVTDWNMLDPDILLWRSKDEDQGEFVTELFELRRVIEPAAAALAANRITPARLAELEVACSDMAEAGEDTHRFLEPDKRFHRTILDSVGNSLFRALAQTVTAALEITLRLSLDAPKGQQLSLAFHKTVLEAIATQNAAGASAAMRALIDDSEHDVAEAQARLPRPRRTEHRVTNVTATKGKV